MLPTKGLTLPLISYGGSSLLIMSTAIMLLLRIDYETRLEKARGVYTGCAMSGQEKRLMVMAGGTGGHVFPGLAVAHHLMDQGWQVRWLGTADRMEADLVPKNGIEIDFIRISGLRGKGIKAQLLAPVRIFNAPASGAGDHEAFPAGRGAGYGRLCFRASAVWRRGRWGSRWSSTSKTALPA